MAATLVQKAQNSNSATAANTTIGSGQSWATPTSGNLLVAWANSDISVTGPSGWTAGPSIVDGNAAYVWYKISNGTETSITFTHSAFNTTVGVLEYSGATVPRDVQNTAGTSSGSSTSVNVSATATSSTGDLWICVFGGHSGSAGTAPTWTNSFTNQQIVYAGTANTTINCATFVADFQNTSAATVNTTVSWTGGTMNDRQSLLIAFPLTSSGGGGTTPTISLVGSTGISSNTAGSFGPLATPGTLQNGDFVVVVVTQNQTTAVTFTGTGWTTLSSTVNTTGAYAPLILYQIWGASSTMPTVTSSTGKWAYCTMAFRSDSGTMVVENTAVGTGQTTAGTTLAAPASSTAKTGGNVSVLAFAGRKSATGATAVTTTEPTGWIEGTTPSQSDASTNAGTTAALQQVHAELCYDLSITGTITPGTATFSQSSFHTGYHLVAYGVPSTVTNYAGWGLRVNL